MGKGSVQPLSSYVTLNRAGHLLSGSRFCHSQPLLLPSVLPVSQLFSPGMCAQLQARHCRGGSSAGKNMAHVAQP
jgi:hypothetical protein